MSVARTEDNGLGIEHIMRVPGSQDAANPIYLDTKKGTYFRKYVRDINNATAPEMDTIEYMCAYNPDIHGDLWLVYEGKKGVVQLTREYSEVFYVGFDLSPSPSTYYFDQELFDSMLAQARSDLPLQEEARKWKVGLDACYKAMRTGAQGEFFFKCDSA